MKKVIKKKSLFNTNKIQIKTDKTITITDNNKPNYRTNSKKTDRHHKLVSWLCHGLGVLYYILALIVLIIHLL